MYSRDNGQWHCHHGKHSQRKWVKTLYESVVKLVRPEVQVTPQANKSIKMIRCATGASLLNDPQSTAEMNSELFLRIWPDRTGPFEQQVEHGKHERHSHGTKLHRSISEPNYLGSTITLDHQSLGRLVNLSIRLRRDLKTRLAFERPMTH